MNIIRWFLNRTRQYINYGRDQFNFENFSGSFFVQQPEAARPGNERDLLKGVKEEVDSRLTQSLHNRELIHQTKQMQSEQVNRFWDAEVKIVSKPTETLSPQTSILEVFKRPEVAGKLLILGNPGVGKTTTMLDLASSLINKAIQDINEPIPVLLNLSSWKHPRQSMSAWLVEELNSIYGVGRNLGKQWINAKKLLPLLDGLDEVKLEHQAACVRALNHWLQSESRPRHLVVCSRREEYEKVIRGRWQDIEAREEETRLHLNGAILLKTLSDEQIKEYLERVDLADLWQVLQRNATVNNINTSTRELNLLELMRTPLFLSFLVFISLNNDEFYSPTRQNMISINTQRQQLFDAYWGAAMKQTLVRPEQEEEGIKSRTYGKRKPPSKAQTRRWLVYLAQQLQRESQTEFLIEKMQPDWLAMPRQKNTYNFFCFLISILILLLFLSPKILSFGPIILLYYVWTVQIGTPPYLLISILNNLQIFRRLNIQKQEIKIFEIITWKWHSKEAKNHFIGGLIGGLISGLTGGLISGLIYALIGGLMAGLLGGLLGGLSGLEVDIKRRPNQGICKSVINTLIITSIGGLSGGLIGVLTDRQSVGLLIAGLIGGSYGGIVGGSMGLFFFGGQAAIQHLALRLTLYTSRFIPWNYARFLNYCTERNFLQRVGGRYRFIHKLLQDHFAEMPIETRVNRE